MISDCDGIREWMVEEWDGGAREILGGGHGGGAI